MDKVRLALVSVHDKTDLDILGKGLCDLGYTILSSGGTARSLRETEGVDPKRVMDVSEYTGYPESPNGLVKTLHPKIHGGLLLNPSKPEHRRYMIQNGIFPINFVAVNLYPFQKTVEDPNISLEAAVEQIDIGGPTMLRAAAKGCLLNHRPIVVCDPKDYQKSLRILEMEDGGLGSAVYGPMVTKIFEHSSKYEWAITNHLMKVA